MYTVSAEYLTAIKKPFKIRRITGTVGNAYFDDNNIVQGSFIIDNQCSEGEEVKIGSVYLGELHCTFRNLDLNGQWFKKKIIVSEGLKLADGTYEEVPLGVYTIYEANHQDDGVAVTAYDNMKKFDKKFKLSTTSGTIYNYLELISTDCGVELAQTEQEIRALPNGMRAYVLYAENDIETYRDLLYWVAQTAGCFATIDRAGKLILRQYGTEAVDTITARDRWQGASFSDFTTYYTGVSVVNVDKGTTTYKGADVDDGLTYNLGSNPLLQNIALDDSLNAILESLQRINYTPFTVSRGGCPAYDLGDMIDFEGGNGNGKSGCLMSFEYTYHGAYSMEGFGSNPALANARSKTDKQIAGIMSRESVSDKLQLYNFQNLKALSLTSAWKQIIHIRFGSLKETMVTFHAEIKLNAVNQEVPIHVDTDLYKVAGEVRYKINNLEIAYHPAETWIEGDHILHLMYVFPIESVTINTLQVDMRCTLGEISIQAGDIHAVITGQGLAASDSWSGYIEVEDYISEQTIVTEPVVLPFSDDASLSLVNVILIEASERFDVLSLDTEPEVEPFVDVPYLNKERLSDLTWAQVGEYDWAQIEELYCW